MEKYKSDHGELHAVVTDHQPGRDAGDYRLVIFANEAAADSGTGDVFVRWAVKGSDGTYSS